MGGGPVGVTWGNSLYMDDSQAAWDEVERHFRRTFPTLRDVALHPPLGRSLLRDHGHGARHGAAGGPARRLFPRVHRPWRLHEHLNAQTLRDMVLDRETELTAGPFVDRRLLPWPPEPVRSAMGHAMRSYLRVEDWANEAELRQAKAALGIDEGEPATIAG